MFYIRQEYTRLPNAFWVRHDRIEAMFLSWQYAVQQAWFARPTIVISMTNITPTFLEVGFRVMSPNLIMVMLWFARLLFDDNTGATIV